MSKPANQKKVAVALSGGVDSAVAAALLQQQGYEVVGFFMKNWTDIGEADYRQGSDCPWLQDYADAQAVCRHLNIPCEIIHFEKEYRDRVLNYFLDEYKHNRTPNPDVLCNTEIKFRAFLDRATELGFPYMATGHYAQVKNQTGHYQLLRGVDPNKDQSYFIHHLTQAQLSHILFPIGHLQKSEVRALAEKFTLPVAKKPDSQGICFIGDIDFRSFLKEHVPATPGPMVLTDGTVMGQHQGLAYYTIGQRSGINLGGTGPYFVVDKQVDTNTLVICRGADHPSLLSNWCTFVQEHWIAGERPAETIQCTVKIRYRSPDVVCTITGNRIDFLTPARAVTPGQFVVFYDGDVVLGGGVISERELCI